MKNTHLGGGGDEIEACGGGDRGGNFIVAPTVAEMGINPVVERK